MQCNEEGTYVRSNHDLHAPRYIPGKSRMKGEKVVTNLVPYGPEKPRSGMQKSAGTEQVELIWDPPKGDFTKYTLLIERMDPAAAAGAGAGADRRHPHGYHGTQSNLSRDPSFLRLTSVLSSQGGGESETRFDLSGVRHVENLSHKLTSFTVQGLDPGEMYSVELATKTGSVATRGAISDLVLTRPLPPSGVMASDVGPTSAAVQWLSPEEAGGGARHTCLRGYQMSVVTAADGKVFRSMAITRAKQAFRLTGLRPATDYEVSLVSLAMLTSRGPGPGPSHRKYESDPAKTTLLTPPEAARNVRLDHATPNSLVVKWDVPEQARNTETELQSLSFFCSVCLLTTFSCVPLTGRSSEQPEVPPVHQTPSVRPGQGRGSSHSGEGGSGGGGGGGGRKRRRGCGARAGGGGGGAVLAQG